MRSLFATPVAALIATAGLTLGASGTAAAAVTITLSGADCTATNATTNGGNVDIVVSCSAPAGGGGGVATAPSGCSLSASPSAPTAGQSFSVTGKCTGGTAPITFALSGTGITNGTTPSSFSATATAGAAYSYTATASNSVATGVAVTPVSFTVATSGSGGGGNTGAPDCRPQGFANTRYIKLDWSGPGKVFYSKDVGGFGPDDALVLELTVPTNATITNTPRTISGAEWIDLGVPRSAFLSTRACDFSTSVFGYGSESAGTSFGVSFAVGSATSAGRWAFPSPVPPKVAPGTTVYLNVKNSTPGSSVANVFATFK